MVIRNAEAAWDGTLKEGSGKLKLGSGTFEGSYTWSSRFENAKGTNPEELLAAAHAGCYSMALSSNLGKAGFTHQHILTLAQVTMEFLDSKNRITKIHLEVEARVPGISNEHFQQIAEAVKQSCPVSVALSAIPTTLMASLLVK